MNGHNAAKSVGVASCQKEIGAGWRTRRLPTPRNSLGTVVTGLKLGREIAVDLKPDADFN
jgi:hypothetical protein